MSTTGTRRRRAQSGRLRGLVHLVPVVNGTVQQTALCGFRPRRGWLRDAPEVWQHTCPRCEAKQGREGDYPEEPERPLLRPGDI